MEPNICANCGAVVTSKFCGQCGAKLAKKEITLYSLWFAAFEMFTNWEQKMLATLKYLFIEPGKIAHAYIQGERRKYYHPVKFLMFWAGINFLVSTLLKVNTGKIDPEMSLVDLKFFEIIKDYGPLFWVVNLPLMSLATFTLYYKSESRFVYHMVIMCYIVGFNNMIIIPTFVIEAIWRNTASWREIIVPLIPFIFCVYFFQNYFKQAIWKSILAGVLTICLMLVGWALIEFIFDFIYLQYNPSMN